MSYPHPDVRAALDERWALARLDVLAEPRSAAYLGMLGVPAAVAIGPDRRVRGRLLDFVPPDELAGWLRSR